MLFLVQAHADVNLLPRDFVILEGLAAQRKEQGAHGIGPACKRLASPARRSAEGTPTGKKIALPSPVPSGDASAKKAIRRKEMSEDEADFENYDDDVNVDKEKEGRVQQQIAQRNERVQRRLLRSSPLTPVVSAAGDLATGEAQRSLQTTPIDGTSDARVTVLQEKGLTLGEKKCRPSKSASSGQSTTNTNEDENAAPQQASTR